jgi:hypothetical protein
MPDKTKSASADAAKGWPLHASYRIEMSPRPIMLVGGVTAHQG